MRAAFVLAAAGGLLLAACAPLPIEHPVELFSADLSGTQEVPAVASAGQGRADLRLERASNLLHWTVRYAGLSGPITAAHLHGPAGPGQQGPAIIPLNPAAHPITGRLRLTPEQATQLESGQWYVSLRTAAHPTGEVRGQLRRRSD